MSYLIYALSCLCCGFVCDGNHKVLVENWTKELKDHSEASSSLRYLSWWGDVSFSCPSLSTCPFFLEKKKTTTQKQNIKCKVWPFLKKIFRPCWNFASLFQGTLICVFQQNPSLDANFSKNNNNKTKKLDHKCTGWLFSQNFRHVVILCSFIHFMIGEHAQLWRSEKQRNKKGHKCILWLFQNHNQILFLLI